MGEQDALVEKLHTTARCVRFGCETRDQQLDQPMRVHRVVDRFADVRYERSPIAHHRQGAESWVRGSRWQPPRLNHPKP
ncbi:MAG: hypothetical protein EBV42_02925 [Actinobacteria bacterium]|nr:hypothetical protein [Actinomycetota bacterium]